MKSEKSPIGTVGIATSDRILSTGQILKGDRVQIIGVDSMSPSRGYDLLDLENGFKLCETGYMSIMPMKNGEIKFEIGTEGVAAKDFESLSGSILKGARVQIVGIDESQPSRGYDLLDLDTGVTVTETGFDSIIPNMVKKENEIEQSVKTL